MVVHFIGSRSHLSEEIGYYRKIVEFIKASGNALAYEWVEDVYQIVDKGGLLKHEAETWDQIDKRNANAISEADVVIVEGTAKSFFSGYQVAQAAAQKKPLLILTRDKSPVAISGLSTPTGFIKSVVYSKATLEDVLREFLSENTIETKDLRFNFFLDRQTYNYLRWMSLKTGKTKAQIVRSLLQKEMNKED